MRRGAGAQPIIVCKSRRAKIYSSWPSSLFSSVCDLGAKRATQLILVDGLSIDAASAVNPAKGNFSLECTDV